MLPLIATAVAVSRKSASAAKEVVVKVAPLPNGEDGVGKAAHEETTTNNTKDQNDESGSTVYGAAFNLTNSIVGAGCIGYGGSFAQSGGLASVVTVIVFAILTKRALDMIIELGVQLLSCQEEKEEEEEHVKNPHKQQQHVSLADASSFEAIGRAAYGTWGMAAVVASKSLFSFGCMVAYFVIIKENAAPALQAFLAASSPAALAFVLCNDVEVTIVVATVLILPLCLPRDISALEFTSKLKLASYGAIAAIVITLYFEITSEEAAGLVDEDTNPTTPFDWVDHWLAVKPGLLPNFGTFILALVASHTVNLVFVSMRPSDRNLVAFQQVSTLAIIAATTLIMSIGMAVYLTFWDQTSSDIFLMYPASHSTIVNAARLFLSAGMVFTYPMPLFSVRDALVQIIPKEINSSSNNNNNISLDYGTTGPTETTELLGNNSKKEASTMTPWWWEKQQQHVNGDQSESLQLILPLHAFLTIALWISSLVLAISAPSLGIVLNLVGCLCGGMLGFLLPGLYWVKLRGWTPTAAIMIASGVVVCFIGTYYSVKDATQEK